MVYNPTQNVAARVEVALQQNKIAQKSNVHSTRSDAPRRNIPMVGMAEEFLGRSEFGALVAIYPSDNFKYCRI